MPPASRRSPRELVAEVSGLADVVMAGVTDLVGGGTGTVQDVEQAVLRGLAASAEAIEQLSFLIESARSARQDVEPLAAALATVEQKQAFFQGCTMRRSLLGAAGRDDRPERCAEQAEALAVAARSMTAVDQLVEAYKAAEGLEARIVELRGTMKGGAANPEPRTLDLPRARVLVARRAIGAALLALDEEDDEELEDQW